jgi:hypothetical protein
MEMSEGNSLYSYFNQTKLSFLFFTKIENRRTEQVLPGEFVPRKESEYGMNTVHACL